ncbi:PREDICTED: retrotransposon, partial [Prunus dulcis]
APRAWNAKFTGYLPTLGFKSSHSDPSLFVQHTGNDIIILLRYVDNIIITGSSDQLIQRVVTNLTCATPCKPHTQVLQTDGEPLADSTMFRSLIGALQYLTFTRPDVAYAVNHVCQYMNNPTEVHYFLVKRILRYVH